jgi:hypothetical protein
MPKNVMKIDQPKIIATIMDFLLIYKDVNLLPNVLYKYEKKEFIVYSYVSGETHFNRGSKLEWMTILIKLLLNKYKKVNHNKWPCPHGEGLYRTFVVYLLIIVIVLISYLFEYKECYLVGKCGEVTI